MRPALLFTIVLLLAGRPHASATVTYGAVQEIFDQHCLDCHGSKEPDGNLVLERFEDLMRGGESGASIVAGKSSDSLLVKYIEGKVEKGGKKKIMPPGKREKLKPAEIAVIRSWIDAGAKPPEEEQIKTLVVPTIKPKTQPKKSIYALAYSPTQKLFAVAHYGEVRLISADDHKLKAVFGEHIGTVNDVAFSPDGSRLFTASGENGLTGEAREWDVQKGTLVRTYGGHKDVLYAVAVSPDGKTLATGSYDQRIKLWDIDSGKELKTLNGHNGAVFDLDFRPDGRILASASGDRTVKLWNVQKGERTDTLSQPTKEVYCVTFSPDGKKLYAGGVDNRIRIWQISETALETTNPILESKFAHEGALLRLSFSENGMLLASSANDKTVKLWEANQMRERLLLENQSDWATGLVIKDGNVVIGRLDGSFVSYDASGKLTSTNMASTSSLSPVRAVSQK